MIYYASVAEEGADIADSLDNQFSCFGVLVIGTLLMVSLSISAIALLP